jgi:Ca2+:H+ antiporter
MRRMPGGFLRQFSSALTESWLNVLLLVAPISWYLAWQHSSPVVVFLTAALSLIPAAGLIGAATEQLSLRSGPALGGFLNATFGNAAELIIAIMALRAHHVEVVKASITGSILGNVLLVFGASCFVGGLKHGRQQFNRTAAGSVTVMLFLAVAALVMPATVDLVSFGSLRAHPQTIVTLSFGTSIVLLCIYGAGLVFTLRQQQDPFRLASEHKPRMGVRPAIALLTLATGLTTVGAETLVGALEPAMQQFGMSELFAGVIVIALIGNAAEHYSAVSAAANDQMTLALEISIGSSAQIALMVAPILVLIAPLLGAPMSLVFNAFEITAIVLSVQVTAFVAFDGESNWLEGLQLLAVYCIMAIAFYLIPA